MHSSGRPSSAETSEEGFGGGDKVRASMVSSGGGRGMAKDVTQSDRRASG